MVGSAVFACCDCDFVCLLGFMVGLWDVVAVLLQVAGFGFWFSLWFAEFLCGLL